MMRCGDDCVCFVLQVESLENKLQASELNKTHYESLLDISLEKLRLLECGEVTPRKNLLRLRQKRALLQSTSTSKTKQQPSFRYWRAGASACVCVC